MWGMVLMVAGGVGPRAFTASCSFALVSYAGASGGAGASGRAAVCPWGVPWGRGARFQVRRLWGVRGRAADCRLGRGSPCRHHIMLFRSAVFCKGSRRGKGFGSGCWLPLGSAMGPRCACRGEAGVGRGGRGANGRGGRESSCLHRIMSFCSAVFCQGLGRGQGLRIGLLVALGECHGAEVRVSR